MTALRYPAGSQSHRPFPHDFRAPEVSEVFMLNGRGWHSPELSVLIRDFGSAQVKQACAALDVDPRRQNVPALRRCLEAMEGAMK
jgi:hypothetical protein